MKKHLGYGRNEIICDKCMTVIGVDEDNENTISIKYKDLNWGHECRTCKGRREIYYDDFVDPMKAYH